MFEIFCFLILIICGFLLGVWEVLQMDKVLVCDVECIVFVYIYGRLRREQLNVKMFIINMFRLYFGFLVSLCFFLFNSILVIFVFINNKILIKKVGIIVVKIQFIDMFLFMLLGLINQFLLGCCVGLKFFVNGLLIDMCFVMILFLREKFSIVIINMVTIILELLMSFLVWNKKIIKIMNVGMQYF